MPAGYLHYTYGPAVVVSLSIITLLLGGGGAMVLGKLPVPGHAAYLDKSRARAFCAYSRCGWGLF